MRGPVSTPHPRALVPAIALSAIAAAAPLARYPAPPQRDVQGPQVTFKVEINYVEVAAVAVDQQGQFVAGLEKGDFQLFEDGKRQEISSFGLVDMPVERLERPLFASKAIEPDVRSNAQPFDGRVYLLVLDDLHTEFANTGRLKSAARAFIESSLGANDMAAVVCTSGRTDASQDFTPSQHLLLAAVDRVTGRALPSATLNKIDDYGLPGRVAPRDLDEPERAHNARATLSALRQLSGLLGGIRGRRKALVLFSEGIDYNLADAITSGQATNPKSSTGNTVIGSGFVRDVQLDTRDTIAAATRANVAIYGVDPRGLALPGEIGQEPFGAEPALNLSPLAMQDELLVEHSSLLALAEGTGGFAAINTNDLATAFDRIRQENSTYYVLGYYPTNSKHDGNFRTIQVRTTRPGVRVSARKGYVAPRGNAPALPSIDAKEATSPTLREALASPLPVSGLRLTAFAAPFKGTAPNAAVTLVLQVDGRDMAFTERNGLFDGTLELSVVALDSQGKTRGGVHRSIAMPLRRESFELVGRYGMRVVSRFDLPPARYQLRIAAMDGGTKLAGVVHYDLEVPDFLALPFSMSGLLLTSNLAGIMPTAGGSTVDQLRENLPGPPTVSREFHTGEELALMAEVYDNQGSTPHVVDISTSVRTDDGREVFRLEDERSSTELGGSRGGFGYTARVPLKGAPPGLYVLRVEARSRLDKGQTTSREIQFRVVR
jgi:VWFA-related protein